MPYTNVNIPLTYIRIELLLQKKTHNIYITKTDRLMLFRDVISD
jgi:hypothetical protein